MDGIDFWEGFGSGSLGKHCIVTLLASMSDLLEQYYGQNLIFHRRFPKSTELGKGPCRSQCHVFGSSSPTTIDSFLFPDFVQTRPLTSEVFSFNEDLGGQTLCEASMASYAVPCSPVTSCYLSIATYLITLRVMARGIL
jgi:hypothetical protein